MNWLEIVIVILIIGCMITGYQKGLIKGSVTLVSLVASLVLVSALTPTISKVLQNNTPIYKAIQTNVLKGISPSQEEEKKKLSTAEQREAIEKLKLPSTIKESLIENNNNEVYQLLKVDQFYEYTASYIAKIILNIITFIICLILVNIIIKIVFLGLDLISKLPVINGINRLTGLGLGFLKGILMVWVLFLVLTMFNKNAFVQELFELINKSELLSFLYSQNVFLRVILNIL